MQSLTVKHITTNMIATPVSCSSRFFLDEEHETKLRCQSLFNRSLDLSELAALCGGDVKKSDVTVGIADAGLYLEFHHRAIGCVGSCLIRRTTDSRLVLINEHVRFLRRNRIEKKKQLWFTRQKTACEYQGISAIHITASRTSISQGYYYYPLFGFDTPIPSGFSRYLSREIAHCRTIHDIFQFPQGRKLWYLYGFSCGMVYSIDRQRKPFHWICD